MRRHRGSLGRSAAAPVLILALAAGTAALLFGASVGPASTLARVAVVVLVVVQVVCLLWMRTRAEWAMAVCLASGVGLEALWPGLGVLGLANVALCLFAIVRPRRVSLWALGAMVAIAPWPALTRGTLAGVIAVGGPVLSWSPTR